VRVRFENIWYRLHLLRNAAQSTFCYTKCCIFHYGTWIKRNILQVYTKSAPKFKRPAPRPKGFFSLISLTRGHVPRDKPRRIRSYRQQCGALIWTAKRWRRQALINNACVGWRWIERRCTSCYKRDNIVAKVMGQIKCSLYMVDCRMIMLIKDETVRICWKATGQQCVRYPGIYMEGLRKAATLCKVIRCQECFKQTHCSRTLSPHQSARY